jgi:hypothetical protein
MLRRAAVWLACAVCVASSASGCNPVASVTPAVVSASPAVQATAKASAYPSCTQSLRAVSTYGSAAVQDAVEGKESLGKAEIDLTVLVLNQAAKSAGNSAVRQSIINLASAYLKLRASLSGTIDSAIENGIQADTSNLKSECGS